MMMKSVFWWRKPEHPEETTDLRQVTDETFHTYGTVKSTPSTPSLAAQCPKLFTGTGDIKDKTVTLHIDLTVVPKQQPHR